MICVVALPAGLAPSPEEGMSEDLAREEMGPVVEASRMGWVVKKSCAVCGESVRA
jgi:hypothetical protein